MTKFENYTDRARKVIATSVRFADAYQHAHIGTEHILAGLCMESDGAGIQALRSLGISQLQILRHIESKMVAGSTARSSNPRPFTPQAKQVVQLAEVEARALRMPYVSTDHLFLALLTVASEQPESRVGQALMAVHAAPQDIRSAILSLVDRSLWVICGVKGAVRMPLALVANETAAAAAMEHLIKYNHTASFTHIESMPCPAWDPKSATYLCEDAGKQRPIRHKWGKVTREPKPSSCKVPPSSQRRGKR